MSIHRGIVFLLFFGVALPQLGATPLDDPHAGDGGFAGPTSGDLASVHWNPAALGLLQGAELMVAGTFRKTAMTVSPSSSGGTFPQVAGSEFLSPHHRPFGPGTFWGIGAGIERRFSIALAMYTPTASRLSVPPDPEGIATSRYHLRQIDLSHTALATGLAIHASESIHLGATAGLLFPDASLTFDEKLVGPLCEGTDCVISADSARIHLGTSGIMTPAYFFSAGVHYRTGRLSLGFAYTSGPLGEDGLITLPLTRAEVLGLSANATPQGSLCPADTSCLMGQMSYRLPDYYTLGVAWKLRPYLTAQGIVRYTHADRHDRVSIRLLTERTQNRLPEAIPLHRGYQDAWDVRGRLIYDFARLRIAGTLRMETSALPNRFVTAASVDGLKFEPSLALEYTVWRRTRISAMYAFEYMLPVDESESAYDPAAALTCSQAQEDLDHPACQKRQAGLARPSAAGRYTQHRHTLTLMTKFGF